MQIQLIDEIRAVRDCEPTGKDEAGPQSDANDKQANYKARPPQISPFDRRHR
jgi:hypothetical protein